MSAFKRVTHPVHRCDPTVLLYADKVQHGEVWECECRRRFVFTRAADGGAWLYRQTVWSALGLWRFR